jgi:hypothetical protein
MLNDVEFDLNMNMSDGQISIWKVVVVVRFEVLPCRLLKRQNVKHEESQDNQDSNSAPPE